MQVMGVQIAPIEDITGFDDSWVRTFRGVPEFSKEELKMLHDWVENDQLGEVAIYLTDEKYRAMDDEMAEFCLRELLRGNL